MQQLFEVKVNYPAINQKTGKSEVKKELYLFEAENFTDAEATTLKELEGTFYEGFDVEIIKKMKYGDVVLNPKLDKIYYKVRIVFIRTDETTGKEKRTPMDELVQAGSPIKAVIATTNLFEGYVIDFEIEAVTKMKYEDVILRRD